MEYKIDKYPNNHRTSHGITENGHMMFMSDVIKKLERLDYVEKVLNKIKELPSRGHYNNEDGSLMEGNDNLILMQDILNAIYSDNS